MHKITLVLLGGLLAFWSTGAGAQMLDAKPEAKGGNPVGTWKADSTALQIYVVPALMPIGLTRCRSAGRCPERWNWMRMRCLMQITRYPQRPRAP